MGGVETDPLVDTGIVLAEVGCCCVLVATT